MRKRMGILVAVFFILSLASVASAQCQRVRLKIALSGAAINGVTPKGNAEFRQRENCARTLAVDVDNVKLPDGTMLNVFVDSTTNFAGAISLSLQGGILSITVADQPKSILVTDAAGNVILSGSF